MFAVNFASHTQALDLRGSFFVGGLDANGGVSRADAVSSAVTTIDSRHNRYTANEFAWRLTGRASPPVALVTGPRPPGTHPKVANCHYDSGAAYSVVFTTGDVTTRDYFHPSVAGQAKAAAGLWAAFP